MPRDDVLPDRPIFVGGQGEWQTNILRFGPRPTPTVSPRARAIATAVFRAAAVWNQLFWSPLEYQILSWAETFEFGGDMDWLTIDLAERAVNAHFRQAITGWMVPAHVIHGAALIRLEEEAQRGS